MTGYFRAYSEKVRQASRELPERELRVYLALLTFANCGGLSWPGYKLLCDITGICNDGIRDALEALVTSGFIDVVRKGARDPLTGQQWSNVYKINGAVIDDPDCMDDDLELPSLAPSSNEDSKQQQRTDSITQPDSEQPEKTTTSTTSDFLEVEEGKRKQKRKAKTKTTERSSIPNPPPPVPPPSPHFYSGSLSDYAQPLPEEQEAAAQLIYVELRHKMPIRNARKLIHDFGAARVRFAMALLSRQSNVANPPGLLRHLLEKQSIEQRDGEAPNPGDEYITGEFADYIEH